jgi:hypothetical protein
MAILHSCSRKPLDRIQARDLWTVQSSNDGIPTVRQFSVFGAPLTCAVLIPSCSRILVDSNVPAPGFFSGPAAKAKHSAWKTQGEKYQKLAQEANDTQDDATILSIGQARAKARYLEIAKEIGWTEPTDGEDGNSKGSGMGMKVSTMHQEDGPASETE